MSAGGVDAAGERPSSREALEAAYRELAAIFRQLDDFRAKLLGLLPAVSGVGIFALLDRGPGHETAPLALLGAAVTLGLGFHEARNLERCEALKATGRELEEALELPATMAPFGSYPEGRLYPLVSTGTASVLVYGATLLAWGGIAVWGL